MSKKMKTMNQRTLLLNVLLGVMLFANSQARADMTLDADCKNPANEYRIGNISKETRQAGVTMANTGFLGYVLGGKKLVWVDIKPGEVKCWPKGTDARLWKKLQGQEVSAPIENSQLNPNVTFLSDEGTTIAPLNWGNQNYKPPVVPSCAPAVGSKVALKADTGSWLARCNGCQKSSSTPDTITIHGTAPTGSAVFKVVDAGGGKVGLQADNGKYVARCNGCITGAPADMLTAHALTPNAITFEKMASGKCALKADNGKYMGRCRGCSPGATVQDTVSIKDTDPNQSTVQLDLSVVP